MTPVQTPSTKTPDKTDVFLTWLEVINICAIVVFAWFAAGLLAWWILFGQASDQKGRLGVVIRGMNAHWRLGALLLVVLFYRTVREILSRIEKGPGGTRFTPKESRTPTDPEEEDALPQNEKVN